MTPQQQEQLKIRPQIEIDKDGPLIKTRLMISKSNNREKQLSSNHLTTPPYRC